MGRRQSRGQSVLAARCAAISTFALLGCVAAQGTLRALLAFAWVLLAIAAIGFEWVARRRLADAARAARPRTKPPASGPGRGSRARRRPSGGSQ
jgi:hypothetical protein